MEQNKWRVYVEDKPDRKHKPETAAARPDPPVGGGACIALQLCFAEQNGEREERLLASFIQIFNPEINIADGLSERPDFIVKFNERSIGVELVDVFRNKEAKKKEGAYKQFFTDVEKELLKQPEDLKGIYRINFTKELDSFDKALREELKPIIITSIVNKRKPLSKYIRSIDVSPHTGIHLYTGNAAMIGDLKRHVIEEIVVNKNEKLTGYCNDKFQELWLLMVIGGVQESSDYNKIEKSILEQPFSTKFDRLFLYDFFARTPNELNVEKSRLFS